MIEGMERHGKKNTDTNKRRKRGDSGGGTNWAKVLEFWSHLNFFVSIFALIDILWSHIWGEYIRFSNSLPNQFFLQRSRFFLSLWGIWIIDIRNIYNPLFLFFTYRDTVWAKFVWLMICMSNVSLMKLLYFNCLYWRFVVPFSQVHLSQFFYIF